MSDKDEITLREAAEYRKPLPDDDKKPDAILALDAMLAASKAGKQVTK
jgi:hypothetical protein